MDSEGSSSSHCPALPADEYEEKSPSNSGVGVDVPAIFLSHSGAQKTFVEQLYNALNSANQKVFLDKHSLPKASPFPVRIQQAARGCRLGVVVLSDEFLSSTWPMRELEMLVLQRGPDAMVLPLFYKLQPKDLKSDTNLSRWRSKWTECGGDVGEWDRAVKTLDSHNGEVFVGPSETSYIDKVVRSICTLVPCDVPYSLSSIQGHERLAKEVSRMFEQLQERNSEQSSCIIGLHGVSGLGKTTLCKCMVNFYASQYHGRSYLIRFPSNRDKAKVARYCRRALKKLTNLSETHSLEDAHSLDQVIHLMEKHMSGHDVFLAVDNVCDSSREEAEELLRVRFSGNSKVLLTSRSEQLLRDLLAEHTNTSYIHPLPAPEHEEAFQIFEKSVKLGDLRSLVDKKQIDGVLKRCCNFNGTYHALALKTLARDVRSECATIHPGKLKDELSDILEGIRNSDLGSSEKVIRRSYERFSGPKKHIFLDIAHFAIMESKEIVSIRSAAYEPRLWLCRLYEDLEKREINRLIYELALDGFIQLGGVDAFGEKMIGVHGLFLELAHEEAARSQRFFIETSLTKPVENVEWKMLERILLLGPHENSKNLQQRECRENQVSRFLDKLQQQKCRKLQVLVVAEGHIRSPIHLDYMPSLRVLRLHGNTFSHGILAAKRVEFKSGEKRVKVRNMIRSGVLKGNGPCQLQVLSVQSCILTQIEGLDALQNLQKLELSNCSGLEKLDGLSGLVRLEAIYVSSCDNLTKMPDLSSLTCLDSLELHRNVSMKEVGCLSFALKRVSVEFSLALKEMPDVSALTCLETLVLLHNRKMKEVGGGCLSSTLKDLTVGYCPKLKRLPSLNDCVHLQTLTIKGSCPALRDAGSAKLASLQVLQLEGDVWSSDHLNEQFKHLPRLEDLSIQNCSPIERLPVESLSSLKRLKVSGCDALREMGDLSGLTCLEKVVIKQCARLQSKKVRGLSRIATHFKRLDLDGRLSTRSSTA